MVKASIGIMVLVVLFTLSTCKYGRAFDTVQFNSKKSLAAE